MKFVLSGVDEQSNERQMYIEVSSNISSIRIDDFEPISIVNNEFFRDLDSYNNNYGGGRSYQARDYYIHFRNIKINTCIENMIRAFAVSAAYLQFSTYDNISATNAKFKVDTIKQHLNNRIMIDWTGDMGTQPQMFFLDHDLIENYRTDIKELYNLRLLQKYQLTDPEEMELFYVPFILPEINNFKLINRYNIWKKITTGINQEIRRITNNNGA